MQVLYQLSYNPISENHSIFLLAKCQIYLLTWGHMQGVLNMDIQSLTNEVEQKTAQTIEVLRNEYAGLRTGRASVHLLDGVRVETYGSDMPLNQVATVSTPDNQTLSVTVWDIANVGAVEKAIRDSGLGLNPMSAGAVIRLNMPPLTEERRKELTKVAGKYAEEAKISMRNIRQDAMGKVKRAVTDKEISEDDQRKYESDLQKIFDARSAEVDSIAKQKEIDIMSV